MLDFIVSKVYDIQQFTCLHFLCQKYVRKLNPSLDKIRDDPLMYKNKQIIVTYFLFFGQERFQFTQPFSNLDAIFAQISDWEIVSKFVTV